MYMSRYLLPVEHKNSNNQIAYTNAWLEWAVCPVTKPNPNELEKRLISNKHENKNNKHQTTKNKLTSNDTTKCQPKQQSGAKGHNYAMYATKLILDHSR